MLRRAMIAGLSATTLLLCSLSAGAEMRRVEGKVVRYDGGGVVLNVKGTQTYIPWDWGKFYFDGSSIDLHGQLFPVGTEIVAHYDPAIIPSNQEIDVSDTAVQAFAEEPAEDDYGYESAYALGVPLFWDGGYFNGCYYGRGYYNNFHGVLQSSRRGAFNLSRFYSSPAAGASHVPSSGVGGSAMSSGFSSSGFHGASSLSRGGFHGAGYPSGGSRGGFHGGGFSGGGGHGGGHR